MDSNAILRELVTALDPILRAKTIAAGETGWINELYYQPTAQYADIMVRCSRRGGGILGLGSPNPALKFDMYDIYFAVRPGVIGSEWVGYELVIQDADRQPSIDQWIEISQTREIHQLTPERLQQIHQNIIEIVSGELTPDNEILDTETPDSMNQPLFSRNR